MYLYGVGRNPPGKITWEDSLGWSVLWELWETIPLDDVPMGIREKMSIILRGAALTVQTVSMVLNLHHIISTTLSKKDIKIKSN